jgi:hypothetical protein
MGQPAGSSKLNALRPRKYPTKIIPEFFELLVTGIFHEDRIGHQFFSIFDLGVDTRRQRKVAAIGNNFLCLRAAEIVNVELGRVGAGGLALRPRSVESVKTFSKTI